jgi:hypothetical protein
MLGQQSSEPEAPVVDASEHRTRKNVRRAQAPHHLVQGKKRASKSARRSRAWRCRSEGCESAPKWNPT